METIIWSRSLFTDSMNFQHIVKDGGCAIPIKESSCFVLTREALAFNDVSRDS